MNLNQSLLFRDWLIQNRILAKLSPEEKVRLEPVLMTGFKEGAAVFSKKYVDSHLDAESARKFREIFEEAPEPTRPGP